MMPIYERQYANNNYAVREMNESIRKREMKLFVTQNGKREIN